MAVSRSRQFLSGLTLNYGYQALLMVAGIWLTPFFLGRIGQSSYGLWLIGAQLLSYLTLTDFGVVALLPLETAYATGRSGPGKLDEVTEIVGQTARLVLYQLPVVAAVAFAMWLTIPPEWSNLRGPLAVVLIGFTVAFPLRLFPALLVGLQDLSFTSSLQVVNWALSTAVSVSMVMAGFSIYALAIGWVVSQTALTPLFVYRLWTRYPGVLPRRFPPLSRSRAWTQLSKGFWINVAQIAELLMSNTDLLIIGRVLGPAAVVRYACTAKLVGVMANQANILMHTATPGLCELKSGGSREKLFQVLVALSNGVLTYSGLVFCLVLIVNKWFVTWWVTAGEYGGLLLTAMILLNVIFGHWQMTVAYSVFCFGHQRRISLTNLGNGLVTAGAALGLTMLLGPIGVPLGSLAGTLLVGLPLNLVVVARDIGVTVPHLVTAMVGQWSWRFLLVSAAVCAVALRWSPKDMLEAAAAAATVATLYALVMFPNVMRSPLGDYVRPLLISFQRRFAAVQGVSPS